MHRTRALALAAAVAALSLAAPAPAAAGVGVGDRAPALASARNGRDRPVDLTRLRGKWVVLTFGASWCDPCKKELPAWQTLAAGYRKRKQPVVFVAVNLDEERAAGERFVRDLRLTRLCVVYDPSGESAAAYDPPKMPTTYVIDPAGTVRHVHAGYVRGDDRHLQAVVDRLLAERPVGPPAGG